jgi:hypothetical protein
MIKTMPNAGGKRTRRSHHPVKTTALWYLKDALIREQYEKCKEIIAVAEEFGAQPYEVRDLLEDPRRSPS